MEPPTHHPRQHGRTAKRKGDAVLEQRMRFPLTPTSKCQVLHTTPSPPPQTQPYQDPDRSEFWKRLKPKPRASVLRREERYELEHLVVELENQIDELRRQAGLPTRKDQAAINAVRDQNSRMGRWVHVNGLYLGHLDSMITNELLSPPVSTLSTFIHLPRDMEQRREVLRGIQELKLRRGVEIATEWLHHLDPTLPFLDEKTFTTGSGECHYIRLEVGQFPNFRSARQLYDTFVQFLYNMEISITEGLGQVTLREDSDDTFDPTIWNHRFLTVAENVGVPEELNLVGFAHFYADSAYTNSPMGVIVYDTVNIDDLYPYLPEKRMCKDIQTAFVVFEAPQRGTNETVVVLKQCRFAVQLPPKFEVAGSVLQQLQKNFSKWPNYTSKYLHEHVVAEVLDQEAP